MDQATSQKLFNCCTTHPPASHCLRIRLDVKGPALQNLLALHAGDHQHHLLQHALNQPVCRVGMQGQQSAGSGCPQGNPDHCALEQIIIVLWPGERLGNGELSSLACTDWAHSERGHQCHWACNGHGQQRAQQPLLVPAMVSLQAPGARHKGM